MTDRQIRPCPVCGGNDRRLVFHQHFLSGAFGEGYDVVACSHCGAGFANAVPSQSELDRYYAEHSKYTYNHSAGVESPWDFKRFEKTVQQLAPFVDPGSTRILDIGCATGGLLSVFRDQGFMDIMGADPSHQCAELARQLHRLQVRVSTLAQLDTWVESFTLITMLGVLEHLRDVKGAVKSAMRLLRPGGQIYVAVPDIVSLADCPNAPYQQFSEEHMNFFSIHTLNHLMGDCGLAPVKTWNWTAEWREGINEPIASGLYRQMPSPAPVFDAATGPAFERYLAHSEDGDRRIIAIIDSLVISGEPILVWGAGTLARRLLATTRFSMANITAFVDSNPSLQGECLANRQILSPDQLLGRNENILICSFSFATEIADLIRIKHRLNNRLLFLFSDDSFLARFHRPADA